MTDFFCRSKERQLIKSYPVSRDENHCQRGEKWYEPEQVNAQTREDDNRKCIGQIHSPDMYEKEKEAQKKQ